MPTVNPRVVRNLVTPLAILLIAGTAFAGTPTLDYSFRVIARTKTQAAQPNAIGVPNNSQLSANFAIDDQGNAIVRFSGLLGGDGVIRYNAADGSIITLATTTDGDLTGEVDARNGIFSIRDISSVIRTYALDGSPINTFNLGGSAGTTGSVNGARLSDNGRVAYRAQAGADVKLILDEIQPPATRTQFTYLTAAAPITFIYSPTVNGSGQLADRVDATNGGTSSFGQIRRYNAPPQSGFVTTINLANNATFNSISQLLDLNDAGQLAFYARLTGTPALNLYRTAADGVTRTLIANPTVSPLTISEFAFFPPAISESGLVAFRARDFNGQAIYLGDGASLVKLIGNGATIDSNIGTLNIAAATVFTGGVRINNLDQVLFIAKLSDNSDALIIASPMVARCSAADIAYDNGTPLPPVGQPGGVNNGVTEGDYNLFFGQFFDSGSATDIANDDGSPLPPFGPLTTNNGVTEGDYNLFFSIFFNGCSN